MNRASVPHCLALGAGMGVLWFALFLLVFFLRLSPFNDDVVNGALMLVSLFGVAAGLPAYYHPKYRNPKAAICLGAAALIVAVPLIAGLIFYLLSGAQWQNHR